MSTLLIAGSRTVLPPPALIEAAGDGLLFVLSDVTELVSGGAGGADKAGEAWAAWRGIKVTQMRPDYDALGGYFAPKMRNREMARYLEAQTRPLALILWDGLSAGSADMATRCLARDIPTRVVPVDPRQYPSGTPPPADWGTREWMAAQRGRRSTLPGRRR